MTSRRGHGPLLRRLAPLLVALATAGPASAGQLEFRGYAYDLSSNRFLYTEVHRQQIEGARWLGGTIDYYAPDGRKIGHKTLDFTRNRTVPVYRMDLTTRGGYMEGIAEVTDEHVVMIKRGYGAREVERVTVPMPEVAAADSGFHVFLRDRFEALMKGETVKFAFVVAGNLDTFRFRARRIGETTFEGKPAVALRVEPASILRWLVDPLELVYDPVLRKLLEYRGVSNLHDPETGKAYNARIIYPETPPADAPPLPAGA